MEARKGSFRDALPSEAARFERLFPGARIRVYVDMEGKTHPFPVPGSPRDRSPIAASERSARRATVAHAPPEPPRLPAPRTWSSFDASLPRRPQDACLWEGLALAIASHRARAGSADAVPGGPAM